MRLTGLTDTSRSVAASYTYDASGQRTRSVVTSGSTTTTTSYTYEGLALLSLAAVRSDGATWGLEYLYDGEGRPYAAIYRASDCAPALLGIVTTLRGDVAELVDGSGNAFALYRYEAFGAPVEVSSAATGSIAATLAAQIAERNPVRYAGYCFDEHSGLYYCSQRYYDPASRQFISKDPIRADGEESAYQYCGGDPVGKVDPSGLSDTHFTHGAIQGFGGKKGVSERIKVNGKWYRLRGAFAGAAVHHVGGMPCHWNCMTNHRGKHADILWDHAPFCRRKARHVHITL